VNVSSIIQQSCNLSCSKTPHPKKKQVTPFLLKNNFYLLLGAKPMTIIIISQKTASTCFENVLADLVTGSLYKSIHTSKLLVHTA
jgi:hypothetical protein